MRHTRAAWAFVAFYALAIAMLGFAHRPSAAQAFDVAAYALPDGTLPPICGHDSDPASQNGSATLRCDACALTAGPGLVASPACSVLAPTVRAADFIGAEQGQYRPPARHAPTSRGPPLA